MKKNRISLYSYIGIVIIMLIVMLSTRYWEKENKVISWDVLEYYSYLPATFIYGGVDMEFLNTPDPERPNKFWPHKSPTKKWVNKFTMGMSIMYSPFFFTAHGIAKISKYDDKGFSKPYKFLILLSSLFYFALSLFLLRKILLKFFKDKTVAITLILISLGTNILFYVSFRSGATHSYNFSLFVFFIYLTIKWHEKPKFKYSLLLGLVIGLISLIRPTNSIIVLFFILYNVKDFQDFKNNIVLFSKNYYLILAIILIGILPWIPQVLYWKAQTGSWFYYSYRDEGFHFNNPQILNSLFSYRNGWLVYTPVMVFSLIGFCYLRKYNGSNILSISLFLILNVFIISSWWCWWYVGYGLRAYIDSYALLSIPLAAFIETTLKMKKVKMYAVLFLVGFALFLNLFQTRQYVKGIITHDSMTKNAYWGIFLKSNPGTKYHQYLQKPDYEAAKKGSLVITD
jgi:hypothetical protein